MESHNFLTLRDTGEILYYENGIYRRGGEIKIDEMVQRGACHHTIHICNEIKKIIQNMTYRDRSELDANPLLLCVKNGIIDLNTMKLQEHAPTTFLRTQINAVYAPNAKADRYGRFIAEVIPTERERTLFHEITASALLRNHLNVEKAVMLVGPGGSGKSVLLKTIASVFGDDNTSAASISDLTQRESHRVGLHGKMLNIYHNTSSNELNRTETINGLISGDPIKVNGSDKRAHIMKPHAVMLFAGNGLPEVNSNNESLFRRLAVFYFKKQFFGRDKDPRLLESLTVEGEKSGILNMLLEHVKTLLENKKLTHDPTIEEMRSGWHDKTDPITLFIDGVVFNEKNCRESKSAVYDLYARFCEIKRFGLLSRREFTRALRVRGYRDKVVRQNGKIHRVWLDVKIKAGVVGTAGGTGMNQTENE